MKNKHQAKEFHLLFANNTKGNGFACTNTNEKMVTRDASIASFLFLLKLCWELAALNIN